MHDICTSLSSELQCLFQNLFLQFTRCELMQSKAVPQHYGGVIGAVSQLPAFA